MYKLHLDLHVSFDPPIPENGPPIILTREIELPFPAYNGLSIHSVEFDACWDPLGYPLSDVIWDVDRSVFLAKTENAFSGFPIAEIAGELRRMIKRGWRLGSFRDAYPEPDDDDIEPFDDELCDLPDDSDEIDRLHTLAVRRRPRGFNRLFKALIRHVAEGYGVDAVVYAMDKTGRYFDEQYVKNRPDDRIVKKWQEATREFRSLKYDDLLAWREQTRRYPELKRVIQRG